MKPSIFTLLIVFLTMSATCQQENTQNTFNFDFEKADKGIPIGWENFGGANYIVSTDSVSVRSGKYAGYIEFDYGNPDFKALAFTLPENYDGKKITLSGFIKTENVSDGYAGLWMRLDPSIAFDNMEQNGIKGTADWQQLTITLSMDPQKTKQIVVGALLVGKGKMWIDDLTVSIDGKDIKDAKPYQRELYPAEKDDEFDEGSGITAIQVDSNTIHNLKILGMVWGFTKYYHPGISTGDYNWDYELFRVLPMVLSSSNADERDQAFFDWINQLGSMEAGKSKKADPSEIKLEPDLNWIHNANLNEKLVTLLLEIKQAKRTEDHFYLGFVRGVKNPEFKNESTYDSMTFPDPGFRILALYRYWNIIQYFFPYKNLIEEDWKEVLAEFIPKILHASNETEYTLTALELIARVHDTHANIWGGNQVLKKYFGLNYSAVELTFAENKAVVNGFHDEDFGSETGLKIGDIITKVNDESVEQIVKKQLKLTPASNYPTQLRIIASNLLRSNDSIITIEYVRNDIAETTVLKTYSPDLIDIRSRFQVLDTCFKFITDSIAYINNGSLKRHDLPKIWEAMEHTKGLILDIRNYPSDFPIYDMSNYLMPESKPFVKFTNGSIITPGLFTYTPVLDAGKKNKAYYKGKVVILINEISQSSAEFHSMAYKVSPNATVIGSTTAGADGNISRIKLPGRISTAISGIGVYYPDGTETQRIGILPDIEIKPTVEGIKNGEDEVLEKAIEIINSGNL